jgi:hypothetical protein
MMRLADGLEAHDLTRQALADGRLHVEQAEAILRALAELPSDLDAKALKHLSRHILEVASPEAADAHEALLVEKEERDAAAGTRLVMYETATARCTAGSPSTPPPARCSRRPSSH